MADCDQPVWRGGTYRDVAALSLERETALKDCTARMRQVRGLLTGE